MEIVDFLIFYIKNRIRIRKRLKKHEHESVNYVFFKSNSSTLFQQFQLHLFSHTRSNLIQRKPV